MFFVSLENSSTGSQQCAEFVPRLSALGWAGRRIRNPERYSGGDLKAIPHFDFILGIGLPDVRKKSNL